MLAGVLVHLKCANILAMRREGAIAETKLMNRSRWGHGLGGCWSLELREVKIRQAQSGEGARLGDVDQIRLHITMEAQFSGSQEMLASTQCFFKI
jgi:hypothetical protein